MIKLGQMQKLVVAKKVDFGVYLREKQDDRREEEVLLPIKQAPKGVEQGDKIEVFVYRDSNDRLISTTKRPKLVLGQIGFLKVAEITRIGAFLNWGLEKDLFLPYKEQVGEIKVNGTYIVGVYIDKSDRLCATMNLYNILKTNSPYKINDMAKGTVFSLRRGLGALVAVDDKYLGLIHEKEIIKPLHIGDSVEVRVNQVKEDGKLGLSFKDAPRLQIDKDGEKIYKKLITNNGKLSYNDSSSPDEIRAVFKMSKSSFKKAIGNLMKRNLIIITRTGIEVATGKNARKTQNKNYRQNNTGRNNGRFSKSDDRKSYNRKDNRNKSNKK